MKHINIITEENGWILSRWSRELMKGLINYGYTVEITQHPIEADVNLYCHYGFYKKKGKGIDIGIFTHKEREHIGMIDKWNKADMEMDYKFAQCKISLDKLTGNNKDLIDIGIEYKFKRPLKIGVVGRKYDYTDRKRTVWLDSLKNETFIDTEFVIADGNIDFDDMVDWYDGINYLLILADNEGGPMPLAECIALGKPVIAPRGVGWSEEYTTILYDSYASLIQIIRGLRFNRNWDNAVKKIIKVIEG